jgi:hypothetical protein
MCWYIITYPHDNYAVPVDKASNKVVMIYNTPHYIDYLIKELCNLTYTHTTLSLEEIIGKHIFHYHY